jgi:hypothetical protein
MTAIFVAALGLVVSKPKQRTWLYRFGLLEPKQKQVLKVAAHILLGHVFYYLQYIMHAHLALDYNMFSLV